MTPEVLRDSAQPTLLDELAAFGVELTEIAVLVAEIQARRHPRLFLATIAHGSILLSGPLEPVFSADPPTGYCARIGLLISSTRRRSSAAFRTSCSRGRCLPVSWKRALVQEYGSHYNRQRPHSALGYR